LLALWVGREGGKKKKREREREREIDKNILEHSRTKKNTDLLACI
jgi:hypothetical protein